MMGTRLNKGITEKGFQEKVRTLRVRYYLENSEGRLQIQFVLFLIMGAAMLLFGGAAILESWRWK